MGLLSLFRFNAFLNPWFLGLLVLVPLLLVLEMTARAPGALRVSTGDMLSRIRGGRSQVLRRAPAVLRALGLALLIIALARPVRGLQPRKDSANVVDIMLCIDVSGSMMAMDFVADGQPQSRLNVTKQAVRNFINNRGGRTGALRGLDRVGLVLYAGYAWTQCPLTLDYGILQREVGRATIDESDRAKQGTAIGSAIGLAVNKLRKSEARSKVIILLTDGLNNAGELEPATAAEIAHDYGIRIYTIGAGTGGEVLVPQQTIFGEQMVRAMLPIDEDALKRIADITGGKYFRAPDTRSLEGAYAEISKLETTEVEVNDYYEHEDSFVSWAALGTAALAVSLFARRYWFDPLP